jgi:penicillin amidase
MPVWVTRHGPVFTSSGEKQMALRWIIAEDGLVQYPILDLNRAGNWQQFTAALARFSGPGSNFVYADVEGNIGYHAAGKLPIRRRHMGDVPVDASQADYEWNGFIPFEQLPRAFNPPGGIIVSANENPFSENYPFPVNGVFGPPYRGRQIRNLLAARKDWRAEDMLAVQKDVYSAFHKFLAGELITAYDHRGQRNPALDRAIELLRSWNGQMERDLGAPFLITLFYQHVRSAFAGAAAPGKELAYTYSMATTAIEKLLRQRPPGWFRDYNEMLLSAFADAVEECTRIQGRDPGRWQYGTWSRVGLHNRVIHEIPWIGRYFDLKPLPMSGGATTIRQSTRNVSPSMRLNADLGDWERSLLNVQIGQSGQILSKHYRDQWLDHYYARSYPMQFKSVEAESTLEFRPK